ncbi:MAG: FAD-dependent oxidoreductase, partial [Pisciglobus halotolerans]|nr:FAD-dependent oxidoreductase [Pisciglobus halotolerans]
MKNTYIGSADGNHGKIKVSVTVLDDEITDIEILNHEETAGISDSAFKKTIQKIIEQQSVKVDAISGATVTSNSVKDAVQSAVSKIENYDHEFEKEKAAQESLADAPLKTKKYEKTVNDSIEWDQSAEFVIVGAGVAGLSAAIEAADLGFEDILLLEKLDLLGGSAFVSAGIMGGYDTELTRELGIDIDPEEIYEEQMAEKKYKLDSELTKLTIDKSGETIDWLINNIGVPFNPEVGAMDGYGTVEAMHTVKDGGAGMRSAYEQALEDRPEIELLTATKSKELIVEDGKVIGVKAEQDGKIIWIKSEAVLLTTGGYSSNYELFSKAHPANSVFQAANYPWSTGDGLIMATEIGAGAINLDQVQAYLRDYEDPRSQSPYLYNIFVGMDGKRFMDEKRTAQTYNQENRDAVIEQTGKDGTDYFWSIADQATLNRMDIGETESEREAVIVADSLDELAKAMVVDEEGLRETVENWNRMVENQEDSEFGRTKMLMPIVKAPYYGLKTTLFPSVTHGGITKNKKAEVTKIDGEVIPGLYAAGELTTVTNSNGYTISNSITFGRIAAQSAY